MASDGPEDAIPPESVVVDGIRLERRLTVKGRGVLGTHRISTDRDDRVTLTLTDPLPADWSVDSSDFHPDYLPDNGSIIASAIRYRIGVDSGTTATVKFGLILENPLPMAVIRDRHAACQPTIEVGEAQAPADGSSPYGPPASAFPNRQPPRQEGEPTWCGGPSISAHAPKADAGESDPIRQPVTGSTNGSPSAPATGEGDHDDPTAAVYAVASAKGGVGKTTTSLNLGPAIARVSAGSVIVVEFDLAMSNFLDFLKLPITPGSDPTIHDVLAGSARVDDAVYLAPGDFDVLPSGTALDGYRETDPRLLPGVIEELRTRYDFVLIDCGAGVSYETILPLGVADEVILVSQPRVASVRDTEKTKNLAETVGGKVGGVVFTNTGTGHAPASDRIVDYIGTGLLGHVPADPNVPESQDIGIPVSAYHEGSPASRAYRSLAETIVGGGPTHGQASKGKSPDPGRTPFTPEKE